METGLDRRERADWKRLSRFPMTLFWVLEPVLGALDGIKGMVTYPDVFDHAP